MTHLHADHAGGCTHWSDPNDPESEAVPSFPNARYLIQRLEMAEAAFPNERTRGTYFANNWEPLRRNGPTRACGRRSDPGDWCAFGDGTGPYREHPGGVGRGRGQITALPWATRAAGRRIWTGWRGCRPSISSRCAALRANATCGGRPRKRMRCSSSNTTARL